MSDSSYSGEIDLEDISKLEMILQEYELEQSLQQQEAEGSNRRRYIPREREVAEARLMADYFGDEPKYTDENSKRCYRMSRKLFLETVQAYKVLKHILKLIILFLIILISLEFDLMLRV